MKNCFLTVFAFTAFVGGFSRTLVAQSGVDPIVTIRATDSHASEAGPDTGTFTVNRTGPTNFALLVFYQLSGTASNGVDYEQLGNSVQIPAGAIAASFVVKPIDDSLVEGDETVVAQLTGSPLDCVTCGYTIGAPSNAVVTIADNDLVATNHAPTVRLNSPQNGDVFIAPANIELRAYAQDTEDGYHLNVEFFEGTNSLGFGAFAATLCPSPYCPYFALNWSNVPPGNYTLTARATDRAGASSVSDAVYITVFGGVNIYATDPNASEIHSAANIDPPSDPAIFTVRRFGETNTGIVVYYEVSGTASNGVDYQRLPGQVGIPAGASSADIVVWPIDDNLVEGTESVVLTLLAPCPQCLFSNPMCDVPEGTNCYPIGPDSRAVAYIHDNDSETNHPPSVSMIAPHNGDVFVAPAGIRLVAFAQDAEDGYVLSVEFFEGTRSLGLGTFNPTRCAVCPNYSLTWSNVPPGDYALRAAVTDSKGARSISDPVRISVTATNATVVTIAATDAIAVEGPFCRSNWWWTSAWNGSNWIILPASGNPGSTSSWTNQCSATNTAAFAVRRSGPTNADLTVYYSIGGSASNGIDYLTLPESITIPAGRHSAKLEVIPIDDSLPEHCETVLITLLPAPVTTNAALPYAIGIPSHAAALILDNDQPRPPCMRLPDGTFHVCRAGTNGHSFKLSASPDLVNWNVLCTNTVTDGAIHYVDPDAAYSTTRFYKMLPEPSYTPQD
jgi:hypothetical protein